MGAALTSFLSIASADSKPLRSIGRSRKGRGGGSIRVWFRNRRMIPDCFLQADSWGLIGLSMRALATTRSSSSSQLVAGPEPPMRFVEDERRERIDQTISPSQDSKNWRLHEHGQSQTQQNPAFCGPPGAVYSVRRARIGSIRDALHAGIMQASVATASSVAATAARIAGSRGLVS